MSLKRQLSVSLGLQAAGAASVLLATLWLGVRSGPEVQGAFNHVKAQIEFVAAFAMFGLPQALFYYVRSGRLALHSALRWAAASAAFALVLAALYAVVRQAPQSAPTNAPALAVGAAAVALAVWHGELRALLLVLDRTAWFNVLTALPQVLVLVGVGGVLALGGSDPQRWFGVFALAYAVAALVAWRRLQRPAPAPSGQTVGWRELARYGAAAWLTAALSTAAVLATQQWVEAEQGRAVLGRFTMAMTLVQVPLTPISYAAPLLLRRWIDRPAAHAARRAAAALFTLLCVASAAVGAAGSVWPDLGLGRAYSGATAALALLLAGGAAEAASRVLTVHASARGLPWVGVRAETARWTVLVLGWLVLGRGGGTAGGLRVVCAVWAVAAAVAAVVYVWHARGAGPTPGAVA